LARLAGKIIDVVKVPSRARALIAGYPELTAVLVAAILVVA
jgi:hypothetical protein